MADIFSKRKRSEIMSHIRSKNTKIEKLVFSALRADKISFKRHCRGIIGNPDIALPTKKRVVFIDGDFWHGYRFDYQNSRLSRLWGDKIRNNIRRDTRNRAHLRKLGWKVLRIWEHEIEQKPEHSFKKIKNFLRNGPEV